MTKLIIFDLDGTLLNTLQDLTNSVNYAMDILSLPKYDCNQVKSMVGNGVAVLMQRAVGLKHIEKSAVALQLQRQYYNKHTDDNTSTYDGVVETLLKLKLNGYTVA
ncbi:MAG: HAD hydrolase-like protein, partial [Clostridia bacterium]|nr:HAD hydrolase-like protein [Clostridia bacterium]